MSIDSMTGYGRAVGECDRWSVEIQCRSVNHKRLEVRVHSEPEFGAVAPRVRTALKKAIHRGRVEVQVDFDLRPSGDTDRQDVIDSDRFRAVCQELQRLAESTGTGPVGVSDVLEFREEIEIDKQERIDLEGEPFDGALAEAIDGMLASRRTEGEALVRDLESHLASLGDSLEAYRDRAPGEIDALQERVAERVRDSLASAEGDLNVSQERLAREVVMHAERADVSEELSRTESHISGIRGLLDAPEPPVGKRLDFYLQELVRETNTLASKSSSSETTDLAVDMKTTVEKMREQAANVE
jgi:uncharacterized protein (TIGR00255 family)